MASRTIGEQSRVARHRGLDVWPIRLLSVLFVVLVWEILRSNVPTSWLHNWPWRLTLLGVAPAAALAGGLLALIAARRQLTLTMEPHIGWASYRDASSVLGDHSAWRVMLGNSGGGRAIVQSVSYRVARTVADVEQQPWVSVDAAREKLVDLGLVEDIDFALRRISQGAGIGLSKEDAVEALALSSKGVRTVAAIDVWMRYQSATRDTYERVMPLIPREGIPTSLAARDLTKEPSAGELVTALLKKLLGVFGAR